MGLLAPLGIKPKHEYIKPTDHSCRVVSIVHVANLDVQHVVFQGVGCMYGVREY